MNGLFDRSPGGDVEDFLLRHRLCAAAYDWEEQFTRFLEEMDRVSSGGPGSLKMIPTELDVRVPEGGPISVTAIDIGGTNVRSAIVTLEGNRVLDIARLPALRTPGFGRRMSAREFFGIITQGVGAHLATDHIGICFSLAAAPLPDGDAVVTAGAKQLDVPDLPGSRVAASFRAAASELGLPCGQQITVINDTLGAALGGRLDAGRDRYSGFIGFIYGTGTNTAYQAPSGELVNVESGAYCGFPTGDIDDLYDQRHIDPGCDRFEKMVSGGYQGGLMALVLEAAEAEGLLSKGFNGRLSSVLTPGALSSADISAFSCDPAGDGRIASACACERDRIAVASIYDAMTGRSAVLCSITITAALLRAGIGKSKEAPAFITAEGSTYIRQKGFGEMLEACMAEYANRRRGLYYEFHNVPDAVLKGTAIAALRRDRH